MSDSTLQVAVGQLTPEPLLLHLHCIITKGYQRHHSPSRNPQLVCYLS